MLTVHTAISSFGVAVPALRAAASRPVWSSAGGGVPRMHVRHMVSTVGVGGIGGQQTRSSSPSGSLPKGSAGAVLPRLTADRRFVSYCLPPERPDSIHELNAALESLKGDPLEQYGGRIVQYRGNPEARIMVVGEGPGAEEDRLGKPFVGRSGELLDKILGSVNINSDTDVYITNLVKRRPPSNRDPTPEEIDFYLPWLQAEMQILRPHTILLMGRIAMRAVLGEAQGITKVHGTWYTSSDGSTASMPLYHPSYLLRNPARTPGSPRYQTWQDIQEVRRRLDQLPTW